MLTNEAIRPNVEPKDRNWDFDIPQLEAILPIGTVDHSIERVYKEVRKQNRYQTKLQPV